MKGVIERPPCARSQAGFPDPATKAAYGCPQGSWIQHSVRIGLRFPFDIDGADDVADDLHPATVHAEKRLETFPVGHQAGDRLYRAPQEGPASPLCRAGGSEVCRGHVL